MSEERPRLFIIDGMSLLFRSFYAMGTKLSAPDGTPIGAVYGFLKIVLKIFKDQNPTHFAVCWDLKEKTFRHEIYPLYKANRGETPPEIVPQIPLIQNFLKQIDFPTFSLVGFEADDIAASLAKYFEHYGDVYLVTSDKDYMQLINENIKMFSLKKGDSYDVIDKEKVIDYFGVPPEQVKDVLALTGDSIDNIPGIKGIGEKTAAKLISQFHSIENLYENLESVQNNRAKLALENKKDEALLSKFLVTLKMEIPLNVSEHSLRYTFDSFKSHRLVKEMLENLGMFGLVKSLSLATPPVQLNSSSSKEISYESPWGKRNYNLVKTKAELNAVFAKISDPNTPYFAFDTETTGLDIIDDIPIGLSLCFETGTAYYIPAHTNYMQNGTLFTLEKELPDYTPNDVWSGFSTAFSNRSALAVAHNAKFDLHQLKNVSVEIGDAPVCCTMIAAWLNNPAEGGFGLDYLTLKNFSLQKIPTNALIGKETGRSSMLDVPLKEISEYACEDADATFRLWQIYEAKLKLNSQLHHLFFNMEMPLLLLLADMERTGVHINSEYLGQLTAEIQTEIMSIEKEIFTEVGFEFKLTSPKQLGDVLFDHLKVHEQIGYKGKLARTTQGYKTDAGVLEQFEAHKIVALIQKHRELSKLLSTYVLTLPRLVKKSTYRVHTHFNQIGTATGRLSSSDPNLQNIPVRTPWGKKVRAAFCASNSQENLVSADYSQIELRVLAHLANDKNMIAAFRSGADIHTQTAAQILGKSPQDITPEERNNAKVINFGIIYGMGPQRLAREQKISLSEAKKFIECYFVNFSGVKDYLENRKLKAHEEGFTTTFFGRIRPIPNLSSKNPMEVKFAENIAINSPIQGTAADIMKLGMIAAFKELKKQNLKTKIIIQVHDELVLEGPVSEVEQVESIVKAAMQNAVEFSVPFVVDIGHGKDWLEAK